MYPHTSPGRPVSRLEGGGPGPVPAPRRKGRLQEEKRGSGPSARKKGAYSCARTPLTSRKKKKNFAGMAERQVCQGGGKTLSKNLRYSPRSFAGRSQRNQKVRNSKALSEMKGRSAGGGRGNLASSTGRERALDLFVDETAKNGERPHSGPQRALSQKEGEGFAGWSRERGARPSVTMSRGACGVSQGKERDTPAAEEQRGKGVAPGKGERKKKYVHSSLQRNFLHKAVGGSRRGPDCTAREDWERLPRKKKKASALSPKKSYGLFNSD